MSKSIRNVLRKHFSVFSSRHTNGKKTARQIDEILAEIKQNRARVESTVVKVEAIINGGNNVKRGVVHGNNH